MVKHRLFILLLFVSSAAQAQTRPLSSREATQMALAHSFSMKKQNVEKAKLDDSYREVLGRIMPQVSAETSMTRYIDAPQAMGMSLYKDYDTSYGFTISQAVYTFGAVSNALDAADAALELQDMATEFVEREIVYAARLAYLGTLMAQRQLRVAEQSLANAKENLKTLQNQFAYGRPPQADLLRINTDIARKVPEVANAKANLQIAETRLKYLLGLEQSTSLRLTDSLDHTGDIAVKSEPYSAITQHPQIRSLTKNIELQESLAQVQRSSTLPSIGMFYSWNASHPHDTKIYNPDSFTKTSMVGLKLNWSIWDGGSNRASYQKALKEKQLAEISLREAQESLTSELKVVLEEFPALKENLQATRKALALAEKSLDMSRKRFSAGKTSVLELNDSETVLTQLRLGEAMAMFKMHEAEAKLARLLNTVPTAAKEGESR